MTLLSSLFGRNNGMPKVTTSSLCTVCSQPLGFGKYFHCEDLICHAGCCLCAGCGLVINGRQLTMQGEVGAKRPYHLKCAKEQFSPRCCVCASAIDGWYVRHPFFEDEICCKKHRNCNKCCACSRFEPLKSSLREPFQSLPDGRSLCPLCAKSVIMDSREATDIYVEVVNFMEFQLNLPIPAGMREVSVLSVDSATLNRESRGNFSLNIHKMNREAAGLTLGNTQQIYHFTGYERSLLIFRKPVFRIEVIRNVTSVLVLNGLPRDLFASILAHEATHVWCKLSKSMPFSMPSKIEEGLCQLIAFKFLESLSSHAESMEEKQRAFFRHQIESSPSRTYGDGFREALRAEKQLGLSELIKYLESNGGASFPKV